MAKVAHETRAEGASTRNFWTKDEELLLAECYIQIFDDPNVSSEQKYETFWYKVLEQYNDQAKSYKFPVRTENVLKGKWTPMNREVGRFNSLVNEMRAMSRENDDDWMKRVEILYKSIAGTKFNHESAWLFLKDKHKWNNPDSTNQDKTEDGLPTRNLSSLETTSCRVHPANKELLRVNVLQTRPLVRFKPGNVSRYALTTI
ncbi:hypothetical protein Tco_0058556 [Tanacetum coccineum]